MPASVLVKRGKEQQQRESDIHTHSHTLVSLSLSLVDKRAEANKRVRDAMPVFLSREQVLSSSSSGCWSEHDSSSLFSLKKLSRASASGVLLSLSLFHTHTHTRALSVRERDDDGDDEKRRKQPDDCALFASSLSLSLLKLSFRERRALF